MVILSILGMGLTGLIFQEIKFSSTLSRLNASLPIARSALRIVFYERANDQFPDYDNMEELIKENSAELCGANSYKYYFVDKLTSKDSEEIIDEGALINLNTASLDVLKRLPGVEEDMADKIANSGLRPYASINEVLLIEGMTVDKFKLFKDMVTVYGNGKVNINTVSKAVLIALGLDEETAGMIVRFRKEHKTQERKYADDGITVIQEERFGVSSLASLIADLRDAYGLSMRQEQDLVGLMSILDVKSKILRFNIIPQVNGKNGMHYSVVISPATKKIISWKEY